MSQRTLLLLGDIAAVPQRSPRRVRKRTPWRPQPDGTVTVRAGERDWFSDRVFVESRDGHARGGYGEAGGAGGMAGGLVGGVPGGAAGGVVGGLGSAHTGQAGPIVVRAGTGMKPRRKIRDVKPVYPAGALPLRAQGAVLIEAVIGPDGSVQDARVLHSVGPLLDQAALDAVRQWAYEPTLLNGDPVTVVMSVVVNFALQ